MKTGPHAVRALLALAVLVSSAAHAHERPTGFLAHFTFEAQLEDSKGPQPPGGSAMLTDRTRNGHDAVPVGAGASGGGGSLVREGKFGNAIGFDGDAALVVPLDLHYELYPAVTITGWLFLESDEARGFVVGTGSGHGPTIRISGRDLIASHPNGRNQVNKVLRPGRWIFFAGTWDYRDGTMRLSWRSRSSEESFATDDLKPPGQDVVLGARNFRLAGAAEELRIDEIRIFGRVLSADELAVLRSQEPGENPTAEQTETVYPGPVETDPADRIADTDIAGEALGQTQDEPTREYPGPLDTGPADRIADTDVADTGVEPVERCPWPGNADPRITYFGSFPDEFRSRIDRIRECDYAIRAVMMTRDDQWLVGTDQWTFWSENLPSAMQSAIEALREDGKVIDVAAISPTGGWLVVGEDEFRHRGIPVSAARALQRTLGSYGRIASFSFDPTDEDRWIMVLADGSVRQSPGLPSAFAHTITQIPPTRRVPHFASFLPNGGWMILTSDLWFATGDAGASLISNLETQGRRVKRRIHHVVFRQARNNYALLSNGSEPARNNDPIWQFENGLTSNNESIWDRMRAHDLTAASIAVVRNNRIAWTRGYGLRKQSDPESYIHPDTIFDAASLSKPIAAFSLLQLVETGQLSVDEAGVADLTEDGVLSELYSLFRPTNRYIYAVQVAPSKGNLAQLLMHCAGIDYKNGRGNASVYRRPASELPATEEIILGMRGAKRHKRIVRAGEPGTNYDYSGANYVLVQALIDVHGGGFIAHTNELFADLGMVDSTYETPAPQRHTNRFARGHRGGSIRELVAYPGMAAASLTTTPTDLAKFVIAVNRGGQGVLSESLVDQYLGRTLNLDRECVNAGRMKLGINVFNPSWSPVKEGFNHFGSHNGYRSAMVGFPEADGGVTAIFTGSESKGLTFWREVRPAITAALPEYQ